MNALKPTTPRAAISAISRHGARHQSAPQREVGDRRRLERRPLARRTRAPLTVHGVELSGMSKNIVPPPAASARLPRRRALPLGAARLVEVHVDVDDAGQHQQAARVDLVARRRQLRRDRDDPAVLDREIGLAVGRRASRRVPPRTTTSAMSRSAPAASRNCSPAAERGGDVVLEQRPRRGDG